MPSHTGPTKGLIAAWIVISFTACGEDTTAPVDTIAPAKITDLAITDSIGTEVTLTWTASGDDTLTGTGAEYDLRYSDSPISVFNWRYAQAVEGEPTPSLAGTSQEMTVTGLAWWTTYYFALRVRDEAGNWSRLSNLAWASPYLEENLRFLVQTRDGILSVDKNANSELFIGGGSGVEIVGDRVYASYGTTRIEEYDFDGSLIRTIPIPDGVQGPYFVGLPGGRFALMSNSSDSAHFIDDAGNILAAAGLSVMPGSSLQSLDGVVVGDTLIISEDGSNRILRADLSTYEITVFRDFSLFEFWGWSAIDYSDGLYYLCQRRRIFRFEGFGALTTIAELPEDLYNITGVVVTNGFSFVTLNFAGAIYGVHNATGRAIPFLEGLDYPRDLEIIRP